MNIRYFIDLLTEDRKSDILKQLKPEQQADFENWFKQIKQSPAFGFKQRDRWLLDIYYKDLTNSLSTEQIGNYDFVSIEKLVGDISKYFDYDYPPINDLSFPLNKPIGEIFKQLRNLEQAYHLQLNTQTADASAPVIMQQGDYIIMQFKDYTKWVFVDRAYCPEEGRSGRHCGNVAGKTVTDQRILSLRNNRDQVLLTFILNPDGTLGEMKAAGNFKPDSDLHPHIIELLAWDRITGIAGKGYLPDANFNMFDLNDQMTKFAQKRLGEMKFRKLVFDQIAISPVDIINSSKTIKSDSEFVQAAIESKPGIEHLLVTKDHKLSDWERAVKLTPEIIIYLPDEFKDKFSVQFDPDDFGENSGDFIYEVDLIKPLDFTRTLINVIKKNVFELENFFTEDTLLIKAPKSIVKNQELMTQIIQSVPDAILQVGSPDPNDSINQMLVDFLNEHDLSVYQLNDKSILNENPQLRKLVKLTKPLIDYLKLAEIAIKEDGYSYQWVPEPYRTLKLSKIAATRSNIVDLLPEKFKTYDMAMFIAVNTPVKLYELLKAINDLPKKFLTQELVTIAYKRDPENLIAVIKSLPEFLTDELVEYGVKRGVSVRNLPRQFRTVKNYALEVIHQGKRILDMPVAMRDQIKQIVDQYDNGGLQESVARLQRLAGIRI